MTVAIAAQIEARRAHLRALADSEFRKGVQRYFQGTVRRKRRHLQEILPAHPKGRRVFLGPRAPGTPRLVLRIAAEKMPPRARAAVLGAAG